MPNIGERRSGATETVEWNGDRWQPVGGSAAGPSTSTVDNPHSFGLLDYIPGARDVLNLPENAYKAATAAPDVVRGLIHNPAETLKGFVSGASEAATPGRVGLLSLLSGGATLPAALAAAGGESAAELGRVSTGAPNAATSFPQAAGRVAEAASTPALAAAASAVPGLVKQIPGAVGSAVQKIGPSTAYGALGALDGYRRSGLTGALEEGTIGALGGKLSGRLGKALAALDDAGGAVAGETTAPVTARPAPVAETPTSTTPDAALSDTDLIKQEVAAGRQPQSILDLHLRNLTGDASLGAPSAAETRANYARAVATTPVEGLNEFQQMDNAGAFSGDRSTGTFKPGPSSLMNLDNLVAKLGGRGAMPVEAAPVAATPSTDIHPFTDFSDAVDPIINSAGPDDYGPPRTGFLSRSTPTAADRAGLAQLRLADTMRALGR